jgi:crossover junction endodeoxyribonuclease RusA
MSANSFVLPWPPSTNSIWRAQISKYGARNAVSPEYRKWKDAAGWELQAQRVSCFADKVGIHIELCPPHNQDYDPDNFVKAILDLLVKHQVIAGDSKKYVRRILIEPVDSGLTGARVTINGWVEEELANGQSNASD